MAIQMRRGNKADFDPSKMLPGEWAVAINNETQNQIVWMCFRAGVVKRMGTYEDFKEQIKEATEKIKNEYKEEFQTILGEIEKLAEQTSENKDTVVQIRDDTVNVYLPKMLEYVKESEASATKAELSHQAAAKSEVNTKASEDAAKASETAAKTSETNAKASETAAAKSATAAAISETNAKASETSASQSAATATSEAASASQSASTATDKATIATQKATEIIGKAEYAADSATKAQSYAVGGTGSREGEDSDNAKYYYEQSKDVSEGLKGGLQPHGTVAFADLPALSNVNAGWMYNVSDEFTTTADFKEGAGSTVPAGANIYKTSDDKWDVLAGTPVTGIKGVNEDSFRRGNVELTAENVGAVATGGDTAENTATFTSSDVADGSASAWTSVSKLSRGEKHSSIFEKVSQMFKNVRYLYKMLGTTDISKIGNGTCTGAISSLNDGLKNISVESGNFLKTDGSRQFWNPVLDLNEFYTGIALFNGNVSNMPTKDWYLVISAGVPGTLAQVAWNLWDGSMYVRHADNNVMRAWGKK